MGGRRELVLCGSEKIDALDPHTGSKLWTVGGMTRECIPTPVFGNGLLYAVSGPRGTSMAIRPGGRGNVTDSHVVWKYGRGAPFVPSAILVGENYYLVDDQGIANCVNALNGRRRWQKRLRGRYTASPVATFDHVYFCNEQGETTVLDARSPKFRQVSVNKLGDPIFASPSISQGSLFIRTTKHLVAIRQ